jgi:hypothetical protein
MTLFESSTGPEYSRSGVLDVDVRATLKLLCGASQMGASEVALVGCSSQAVYGRSSSVWYSGASAFDLVMNSPWASLSRAGGGSVRDSTG